MRILQAMVGIVLACGPEYPSGHVLDRPRVLAVRLDPPEATIGDLVRAQALVAFPEGTDPEANVALWQCPPDAYFPHGCVDAEGAVRIGDDEGEIVVGEDWRDRVTRADPFHSYLIVTAAVETNDDEDVAIKRLVVGLPDPFEPPNRNPVLEEVRVEGSDEVATLTPVVGEGSVETYRLRTIDGDEVETEEEMYVSWYASDGALGPSLTRGDSLATSWRGTGPATVWAVLRDGRGGTAWIASEVGAR